MFLTYRHVHPSEPSIELKKNIINTDVCQLFKIETLLHVD